MTHLRTIVLTALVTGTLAAIAGCTGRAGYGATVYSKGTYADPYYDYGYTQPTMVGVYDGVWAVEGRSYPVFYSGGAYWRYDNGLWYRSGYVDDGYVRVRASVVPRAVRRIDRPRRYIRYHHPSRDRVRVVPRTHIRTRGDVRYRGRDRGRVIETRPRQRYERRDIRQRRHDRRDVRQRQYRRRR